MRVIKFRFWDTFHKKLFIEPMDSYQIGDCFDDERFIAMQYTELKDRNGTEIYEGDIIKTTLPQLENDGSMGNETNIGIVAFKPHEGYFMKNGDYADFIHSDYSEVIGNIHQNPGLI